jgi:SAM-dependent methyltransferase
LRVLEVGAGTGGTTSALLDALGARSHYTFTDVSRAFFDRANERFSGRRKLSFATLDFDKDPTAQGFAPASFDVIAAANTVHASVDLRAALAHLRTLLAPGGVLILVESTVHFKWFDMTTGLIEGWQHFADDLRSDNPLLDVDTWHSALAHAGFAQIQAWPQAGAPAEILGQHVIVARVAGERVARDNVEVAEEEAIAAALPATSGLIIAQLREAYPSERLELLRDYVRKHVMRILDLPADMPPDRDSRLMDLGLDSLMAVQLRGVLARELSITLPASLIFDHPTIDAIAGRVLASITSEETSESKSVPEMSEQADRAPVGGAVPTDEEIEAILMGRSSHG